MSAACVRASVARRRPPGTTRSPAAGVTEARAAIAKEAPDCVLLYVRLKDGDGIAFLSELKGGLAPDAPVIMATAYGDGQPPSER